MTGEYNINQDIRPVNFAGALQSGLQAGQQFSEGLLKQRQMQKVAALQDQYVNTPDAATKQGLLQQIAVYNPEHAKGMLAISNAGINPFEGNSMEAQAANIQYQRRLAAGEDPGTARLNAINDVRTTNVQQYTDAMGNRVSIGGIPLPDVGKPAQGALGAPIDRTVTATSLPPVGGRLGGKPSGAEEVVNNVMPSKMAIADHADLATPEEIQFAKDFAAQPRESQANWYAKNASAHSGLPESLTPEVKSSLYDVADHFNNISVPSKVSMPNNLMNAPKVQVAAAEDQIKKAVELGNLQTATAKQLEEDMIKSGSIASQLSDIKRAYKPEYLTYGTQANMTINSIKEKIDSSSTTPQEKQQLADYTSFRANAGQMFSNVLKDLSGAAVNPAEFKRAEAWLPNADTDSPTQFDSKVKRMTDFTNKALARQAYIRNNGFTINPNSSIDKILPLDSMPVIMNKRGDAIEKELAATGLKGNALKSAVYDKLSAEFGLVR